MALSRFDLHGACIVYDVHDGKMKDELGYIAWYLLGVLSGLGFAFGLLWAIVDPIR